MWSPESHARHEYLGIFLESIALRYGMQQVPWHSRSFDTESMPETCNSYESPTGHQHLSANAGSRGFFYLRFYTPNAVLL